MNLFEQSKAHLALSRMGYITHARQSIVLGFKLMWLGVTSIFHGLIPAKFIGDAPLGVTKMFYQVVIFSPNPVFQTFIAEQKRLAEQTLQKMKTVSSGD